MLEMKKLDLRYLNLDQLELLLARMRTAPLFYDKKMPLKDKPSTFFALKAATRAVTGIKGKLSEGAWSEYIDKKRRELDGLLLESEEIIEFEFTYQEYLVLCTELGVDTQAQLNNQDGSLWKELGYERAAV